MVQRYEDESSVEVYGSLAAPPNPNPAQVEAFRTGVLSRMGKWGQLVGGRQGQAQFQAGMDYYGYRTLPFILAGGGDEIRMGVEAALTTVITGAWTAFETLAGDLWEAAVNAYPKRLALLRGSPRDRITLLAEHRRPRSKQTGKAPDPNQNEGDGTDTDSGVSIPVNEAQRVTGGSYNLSEYMGTVLRTRFSFTRLEDIREAYSRAFAEQTDKIDAALANNFIDALKVVRNVIVHKAGKADREYCDDQKRLATILPRLEVGQRVELAGKLVADLVRPAAEQTVALIKAVDAWVDSHRKADAFKGDPDAG